MTCKKEKSIVNFHWHVILIVWQSYNILLNNISYILNTVAETKGGGHV
jgi:hypothetical protein